MSGIEEVVDTPTVEEVTTEEVTTEEIPKLTIQMLENMRNLVEVAISRGAYRAGEVSSVGKIYDEFVTAFEAVKKSKS